MASWQATATLLLDGEGTVEDLLRERPKALDPGPGERSAFKEAKRLLEDFGQQASVRSEVDPWKVVPVLVRFQEDFETVCGSQGNSPCRLHQFFSSLREVFLNELLLIPQSAEDFCMAIIVFTQCEMACLRCVELILSQGDTFADTAMAAVYQRVAALARELQELSAADTSLPRDWLEGLARWASAQLEDSIRLGDSG
ncbi:unnamed protein product, partial [Effrenium voratum]